MSARKIGTSWWVDLRHRCRRYRLRSPENTRGGALAYEAHLRQAVARGDASVLEKRNEQPADETFAAFSTRWLETYAVANNKPAEVATKKIILNRHLIPALGRLPLRRVGPALVELYKNRKLATGLSPKTVNNHLAVLGKCLRTAVEWEALAVAPTMRLLRAPAPKVDFLGDIELTRLLSCDAEPVWREVALVAATTGLRRGEFLALCWGDVDLARHQIIVRRSIVNGIVGATKNYRERIVPLTQEACRLLARRQQPEGYVFCQAAGDPFTKGMAETAIVRMCRRVGLRQIGWHTLRHTYASRLVSSGVPLNIVRSLLGHQSIEMTMRYAHFAPEARTASIACLEGVRIHAPFPLGQQVGNDAPPPLLEPKVMTPIPVLC